MFEPFGPLAARLKLAMWIGAALLLFGAFAWVARIDHLRQSWKGKFEALAEQAAGVLTATRLAADNPQLRWQDTAGQVVALGESNRDLKQAIETQNRTVYEMAREAVRLRAHAAELQAIAARAEAQRRSALARLSDMAITPGTREDCMQPLDEAEQALDLVREAGL